MRVTWESCLFPRFHARWGGNAWVWSIDVGLSVNLGSFRSMWLTTVHADFGLLEAGILRRGTGLEMVLAKLLTDQTLPRASTVTSAGSGDGTCGRMVCLSATAGIAPPRREKPTSAGKWMMASLGISDHWTTSFGDRPPSAAKGPPWRDVTRLALHLRGANPLPVGRSKARDNQMARTLQFGKFPGGTYPWQPASKCTPCA